MHTSPDFIATKTCRSCEFVVVCGQLRVKTEKVRWCLRGGASARWKCAGKNSCGCGTGLNFAGADKKYQPAQDSNSQPVWFSVTIKQQTGSRQGIVLLCEQLPQRKHQLTVRKPRKNGMAIDGWWQICLGWNIPATKDTNYSVCLEGTHATWKKLAVNVEHCENHKCTLFVLSRDWPEPKYSRTRSIRHFFVGPGRIPIFCVHFCSSNSSFAGSSSENCCTSQFVYRVYTRGAKRDPTPHWENAEKFIKDLKGAWLNGGVQIEQRN